MFSVRTLHDTEIAVFFFKLLVGGYIQHLLFPKNSAICCNFAIFLDLTLAKNNTFK